ncbi:MAG: hypothetical protein AAFP70_18465, partial [Calditrichota bacterium]
MSLSGTIIPVSEITPVEHRRMLQLMQEHYHHVDDMDFATDLSEKDWVILLRDKENAIRGFSTQLLFEHAFEGEKLLILFSGDTVIEAAYWGSMALPIAWGQLMLSLKHSNPGHKLYWMLITKGVRTYRFLPVFFKEFYPRYDIPTPKWEGSLIHSLAKKRYPGTYDDNSGLIVGSGSSQSLKNKFDIKRKNDPHVKFFRS